MEFHIQIFVEDDCVTFTREEFRLPVEVHRGDQEFSVVSLDFDAVDFFDIEVRKFALRPDLGRLLRRN